MRSWTTSTLADRLLSSVHSAVIDLSWPVLTSSSSSNLSPHPKWWNNCITSGEWACNSSMTASKEKVRNWSTVSGPWHVFLSGCSNTCVWSSIFSADCCASLRCCRSGLPLLLKTGIHSSFVFKGMFQCHHLGGRAGDSATNSNWTDVVYSVNVLFYQPLWSGIPSI